MAGGGGFLTGDPCRAIRDSFIYLKDNLITHTTLIDELLACSVLSDEEKADYKNISNIHCGKLIKKILRKGEAPCKQFLEAVKNPEYGIFHHLEKWHQTVSVENDDLHFPRQHLKKHRDLFLDELEPSKTADYLYQFRVIDIESHDEIEGEVQRMKKTQMILAHLEKRSDDCWNTFIRILKFSAQDFILSNLEEEEQRKSLTPKEECVECVRINFRWIRDQLHFEITADHLIENEVISSAETPENTKHRGFLVKSAIRKGHRGCETLLRCLEKQQKETFEKALKVWKDRKNVGQRLELQIRLQMNDLIKHENFLISELEPLQISDILLEENALSLTEHDNIETVRSLRRRNEILLACIKEKDKLDDFERALMQSERDYILKTLKTHNEDEEQSSAPSSSEICVIADKGVPQIMTTGIIGRFDLKMKIEEKNNPDSEINKIVTVINNDPSVKIEVVDKTHMAVQEATTGSVIIHLSPLTDNALHRFLSEDGRIVQSVTEKLLATVGLDKLFKEEKGFEVTVKISSKELSPEDKVDRSQNPDDIMRRKMRENKSNLIDELEPSQLISFLIRKEHFSDEDRKEIDKERGRKRRVENVLDKIRSFPDRKILESFLEYLQSAGRKDLKEIVQATEKDQDIHKSAEKVKQSLLRNYKGVVEELETNIIQETLQSFIDIHKHDIKDDMESFLPASGKSRKERMNGFLTYVFRNDEYVLQLEKVLKKNSLDHLLAEKEEQEEGLKKPEAIEKVSSPPTKLKEGELFECTYKIVEKARGFEKETKTETGLKDPEEDTERSSGKNLPFLRKGDEELSRTAVQKGEIKLSKEGTIHTESASMDKPVVAAIDFGTTYSGFAYSLKKSPSDVVTQKWECLAADQSLSSLKTPTTLLLDKHDKFKAFGFEAERVYKENVEDGNHTEIRFFKNFKMKLHQKESLDSSLMIEDHMGKPLNALRVFEISLQYLKDKFWELLRSKHTEYGEEDVHWIITVPAIWDEFAKQFMRRAAEQVNIPKDQLTLALEPEAAAIYVITEAKTVLTKGKEPTIYDPGKKVLVADLGGGTADFSVVEVTENHRLKHLYRASGGDWGGKVINEKIFQIFTGMFGDEVMTKFREMKAEVLEMENDIDIKKRDLKIDDRLHVRLLPALTTLCKETSGRTYNDMIKKSEYQEYVKIRGGGKISFEPPLVYQIFKSVVGQIANHIKTVLEAPTTAGVETIILVGGFAECNIINKYIEKEFPKYNVKIPQDPGLAVLKGAVKFGHDQGIIAARVCNYTYGLESNRYLLATDPKEKRQWIGDQQLCTGVFEKLITIGDMVKVGQEVEKEVFASTADMTKMTLKIYKTRQPNPQFITDEGCELFGEMMVEMPSTKGGQDRSVTVSMRFGETEILFSGQDKTSTRRCELTLQLPVYG